MPKRKEESNEPLSKDRLEKEARRVNLHLMHPPHTYENVCEDGEWKLQQVPVSQDGERE